MKAYISSDTRLVNNMLYIRAIYVQQIFDSFNCYGIWIVKPIFGVYFTCVQIHSLVFIR